MRFEARVIRATFAFPKIHENMCTALVTVSTSSQAVRNEKTHNKC